MRRFSLPIDPDQLQQLLQATFAALPPEYAKALPNLTDGRRPSFFRETLISKWIPIQVQQKKAFDQFPVVHRIVNIFVRTKQDGITELQIYLANHGIHGISIGEDLDNLLLSEVNANNYRIEQLPVSPFYKDHADLEKLEGFEDLDLYMNYVCPEYIIDGKNYYAIIELSDEKSIAIDDAHAVYQLNTHTGMVKLLYKRPKDFIQAFLNDQMPWLFE